MIFGPVPTADALGAVLAHSIKLGKTRLRKGIVLTQDDIAALQHADIAEVIVARMEPGDVGENDAAARLAKALTPDPDAAGLRVTAPFTGRVNLVAAGPGVVMLDTDMIDAVNRIDPMITVATVPQHQQMEEGGLVATIKIIAYGVSGAHVSAAEAVASQGGGIRMQVPRHQTAGLIMTTIPGGPDNAKGKAAIEARVTALGMRLKEATEVPHREEDIARVLANSNSDVMMILTASATSDPYDVAPQAVRHAGGEVERFGMPVDPGNLLFLGQIGARPVIGLPGCARSPALNGADWILSRVACGIEVSGADIARMGVGGLLKEIPTRPQPRSGKSRNPG